MSDYKLRNFINGRWQSAGTDDYLGVVNPATAVTLSHVPLSPAADVDTAVQAAQAAFPGWAAQTPVARGRILSKTSQLIEARKPELAKLLTREEGKTLAEATGEVQRTADIFRFFGGISYTLGGQTIPHDLPGNLLYTRREPLGVDGVGDDDDVVPAQGAGPGREMPGGGDHALHRAAGGEQLAGQVVGIGAVQKAEGCRAR